MEVFQKLRRHFSVAVQQKYWTCVINYHLMEYRLNLENRNISESRTEQWRCSCCQSRHCSIPRRKLYSRDKASSVNTRSPLLGIITPWHVRGVCMPRCVASRRVCSRVRVCRQLRGRRVQGWCGVAVRPWRVESPGPVRVCVTYRSRLWLFRLSPSPLRGMGCVSWSAGRSAATCGTSEWISCRRWAVHAVRGHKGRLGDELPLAYLACVLLRLWLAESIFSWIKAKIQELLAPRRSSPKITVKS